MAIRRRSLSNSTELRGRDLTFWSDKKLTNDRPSNDCGGDDCSIVTDDSGDGCGIDR